MKFKLKLIILLSLVIICFSNPIFARYYEKLNLFETKATIAEPIIKIDALQKVIKTEITKETNVDEYDFVVKNYETENNNKRISEVDFSYSIEIKNSNDNFPVRYELYDIESGEEILKENTIVSRIENFKKYRI